MKLSFERSGQGYPRINIEGNNQHLAFIDDEGFFTMSALIDGQSQLLRTDLDTMADRWKEAQKQFARSFEAFIDQMNDIEGAYEDEHQGQKDKGNLRILAEANQAIKLFEKLKGPLTLENLKKWTSEFRKIIVLAKDFDFSQVLEVSTKQRIILPSLTKSDPNETSPKGPGFTLSRITAFPPTADLVTRAVAQPNCEPIRTEIPVAPERPPREVPPLVPTSSGTR